MHETLNPLMKARFFHHGNIHRVQGEKTFTAIGATQKAFFLFAVLVLSAGSMIPLVWYVDYDPLVLGALFVGSFVAGFLMNFFSLYRSNTVPFVPYITPETALLLAVFQGVFLGVCGVSLFPIMPRVVLLAFAITFPLFFSVIFLYAAGFVPFKNGIIRAAEVLGLSSFVLFILLFFLYAIGLGSILDPIFRSDSWVWSVVWGGVMFISAMVELIITLDFIEYAEQEGASKRSEWYATNGLLMSLLSLYVLVFRILQWIRNGQKD